MFYYFNEKKQVKSQIYSRCLRLNSTESPGATTEPKPEHAPTLYQVHTPANRLSMSVFPATHDAYQTRTTDTLRFISCELHLISGEA